MKVRTAAAASLAAVAALGALAPASAAGKPVVTKYTAQATPDPTTTTPGGEVCDPVTPTARHRTVYKVPAAGTVKVELANTLDWAIGIREGEKLLGSADGASPEVREVAQVKVKKAVTLNLDVCNFAGEPSVAVTVTFTPAV